MDSGISLQGMPFVVGVQFGVIFVLLSIYPKRNLLLPKMMRTILGFLSTIFLFGPSILFALAYIIILVFIFKPFQPVIRKRVMIALSVLFISAVIYSVAEYNKSQGLVVAEQIDENRIKFNGDIYYAFSTSYYNCYHINKDLGRIKLKDEPFSLIFSWNRINSIKYDPELNYIYFNDQLYSKTEGDKITVGNNATAIYLGYNIEYRIVAERDINLILSLPQLKGESYSYNSESSGRFSEDIFVAYDNNPIPAVNMGNLAKIYDTWIYVPEGNMEKIKNNEGKEIIMENGIIIDDAYITHELTRIAYENNIISLIQADPSLRLPARTD